ncbi:MAG TPA: hypothetical protein VEX13_07360 [Chloroflexia bacterium]|nr:hypothetical protein [Chloroflexia bacterium]
MLFSPFITFKYRISRRFGLPHLFPTRSKATLYNAHEEGDAPPDELSYEDALLDAQLRLFMRAEYDGVQSPGGQYAQVERLITQDEEAAGNLPILASQPPSTPFLPPLTADLPISPFRPSKPSGRFYRLLTGTASARLLPGGIALALTMMVLGANVSQLLSGDVSVPYGRANPTTIVEWDPQDVPPPPQVAPHTSVKPEIYFPDPAEVIMPGRPVVSARPTPPDTTPMRSQELLLD